MTRADLVVREAEIGGHLVDVRIGGGRITSVGVALPRERFDEVIDAEGGALLPGLVDHHLHLFAMAAAQASVLCGPPAVHDRAALAIALALAPTDERGWVRGVGYHASVAGDVDAAALDTLHPHRPVRLQHRSGALWMVNSRGAMLLGLAGADHPGIERDAAGTPTGRLWRADGWLGARLPRAAPPDLAAVGARLSRWGITAGPDATPDLDGSALAALGATAAPQRIHLLGVPLGVAAPDGTTAGPYKIVLADSGLPGLDELTERIRAAHATGRGIAAHCVTREALILLLTALDDAGTHHQDRIEHAALVPADVIPDIARRGLRVITQPGFLADRGDSYLRDVPGADHVDLYRCRSLADAGVPLALSSDAPYGPPDPWAVIVAAVHRHVPGGAVAGPAECLTASAALDAYLAEPADPGGAPRRVTVGTPADLVLLRSPLREVLSYPAADSVRATLISGVVVHHAF